MFHMIYRTFLLVSLILVCQRLSAQASYDDYANFFKDYDFDARQVPTIPPKGERIDVIIDADAKNEIDDQWALALALLSPERFNILGIVGGEFSLGWTAKYWNVLQRD